VEALKQLQVVQVEAPTGTALQARAQPTKDLTAVVAVEMMETPIGSMPVEAAAVQAQWAQMSAIPEGLHLVVPAAQVSRTALPELHRVMPEVAEAGTPTRQQTVAQTISLSKVENVVPPWWVAQAHEAQTRLQVQPILDPEAVAADSTEVQETTPVVQVGRASLLCATSCPHLPLPTYQADSIAEHPQLTTSQQIAH
jgi:hypothetical protein